MTLQARDWKAIVLITLLATALAAVSDDAKEARMDQEWNLDPDGLAIDGYDPVAYFEEGGGEATPGKSDLTYTVGKTTYRFASEANRDLFKANPAKYEPAYGGWCAYAMGKNGEKVGVNPKAYTVTDGRLYLFYKTLFTDTRKPWNKDLDSLRPKADAAWRVIVEKAAAAEKSEP